ncbi:MAG: hypothetical protein HRU01_09330 [Myxococcales bacterium]|nr:hypothetical protein [Myxococcales bacterium]
MAARRPGDDASAPFGGVEGEQAHGFRARPPAPRVIGVRRSSAAAG